MYNRIFHKSWKKNFKKIILILKMLANKKSIWSRKVHLGQPISKQNILYDSKLYLYVSRLIWYKNVSESPKSDEFQRMIFAFNQKFLTFDSKISFKMVILNRIELSFSM